MKKANRWLPSVFLGLGVLAITAGTKAQRAMPLQGDLGQAVPAEYFGWPGRDVVISDAEQEVAGMDSYVLRVYEPQGVAPDVAAASGFSVYVGYYESQSQGNTIHSPKNCLPGAGWEPLVSKRIDIAGPAGPAPVNQYLIGNGGQQAMVLYWYQGRGRVEANEYVVKWELLRDQAFTGRSDEALVRVVVPVVADEAAALAQAVRVAEHLMGAVDEALPPRSAVL